MEKMVFFEIVALYSCQLRTRKKHKVTTCDLKTVVVKVWPSSLQQYEKKIICPCFWRISKNKIKTTTFQKTFCWLLSPHWKNSREGKLTCLLHIALISNAFFDESKNKRKRYPLKSVRSKGTKWKIQYLLRLKTYLFCFWL